MLYVKERNAILVDVISLQVALGAETQLTDWPWNDTVQYVEVKQCVIIVVDIRRLTEYRVEGKLIYFERH